MLLRITKVEGIHDHSDIRTVLTAHFRPRDIDQLDPSQVKVTHVGLVLAPVAVGALINKPPLFEEAFQNQVDVQRPPL